MRDWRADIRARLADGRLDPASEAEIVEEIAQHLEDQFGELRARGMSEADANAALTRAARCAGLSDTVCSRAGERREPCRRRRSVHRADARTRLSAAWQDLRYGVRSLRRAPVFATVAVLSLGLGIGATTAIFGLLNAVLLERLAVPHPEQLIGVQWSAGTKKMADRLSFRDYDALAHAPGLPKLAAAGSELGHRRSRTTRATICAPTP